MRKKYHYIPESISLSEKSNGNQHFDDGSYETDSDETSPTITWQRPSLVLSPNKRKFHQDITVTHSKKLISTVKKIKMIYIHKKTM